MRILKAHATDGHVTAWTDAYIISEGDAYFISIYGQSQAVRSISAQIMSGYKITILDTDGNICDDAKSRWFTMQSMSTVIGGKIVHKIMWAPSFFTPWLNSNTDITGFLTYGANEAEAKERLYKVLDRVYDIPLRPEWTDWLWHNMESYEPTVYAPDRPEFTVTRFFILPLYESDFYQKIVEGIKRRELQ